MNKIYKSIDLNNYVSIDIKINAIHFDILERELNKHNISLDTYIKDCLTDLRKIKEL